MNDDGELISTNVSHIWLNSCCSRRPLSMINLSNILFGYSLLCTLCVKWALNHFRNRLPRVAKFKYTHLLFSTGCPMSSIDHKPAVVLRRKKSFLFLIQLTEFTEADNNHLPQMISKCFNDCVHTQTDSKIKCQKKKERHLLFITSMHTAY